MDGSFASALIMSSFGVSDGLYSAHRDPIPEGELAVHLNAGAQGIVSSGDSVHLPHSEFGIRYGLSDTVDIGVSSGVLSLTTDLNAALIQSDSFALSVDPTIHVLFATKNDGTAFFLTGTLPVLMDVVKTDAVTVVVGAGPGLTYVFFDVVDDEEAASQCRGG